MLEAAQIQRDAIAAELDQVSGRHAEQQQQLMLTGDMAIQVQQKITEFETG